MTMMFTMMVMTTTTSDRQANRYRGRLYACGQRGGSWEGRLYACGQAGRQLGRQARIVVMGREAVCMWAGRVIVGREAGG